MADRTTIAIAKVDMLFSREPFAMAIARIGIVVPSEGTLISPDPNNPALNLWVMDGNSNGWQPHAAHPLPNIHQPVVWRCDVEEAGRRFYYWEVQNGDEHQVRALKATFVWRGAGPHIVEGVVRNKSGYRVTTRPARLYDAPWFELGLELPSTTSITGHHRYCCEGDGRHAYVEGDLPWLHSDWSSQGTPGWPGTANHNYWGVYGFNEHSTSARGLRVEVDTTA
jgi:hypothetical protein